MNNGFAIIIAIESLLKVGVWCLISGWVSNAKSDQKIDWNDALAKCLIFLIFEIATLIFAVIVIMKGA